MAGIEDCYTSARGATKTLGNFGESGLHFLLPPCVTSPSLEISCSVPSSDWHFWNMGCSVMSRVGVKFLQWISWFTQKQRTSFLQHFSLSKPFLSSLGNDLMHSTRTIQCTCHFVDNRLLNRANSPGFRCLVNCHQLLLMLIPVFPQPKLPLLPFPRLTAIWPQTCGRRRHSARAPTRSSPTSCPRAKWAARGASPKSLSPQLKASKNGK